MRPIMHQISPIIQNSRFTPTSPLAQPLSPQKESRPTPLCNRVEPGDPIGCVVFDLGELCLRHRNTYYNIT